MEECPPDHYGQAKSSRKIIPLDPCSGMWNIARVLASFGDKETEKLWHGQRTRLPTDLLLRATDKLNILDAATTLDTLRIPPSNRLEALKGNRAGQHCIRINDQWRLCFRWEAGNAHQVAITDYH
jgi:proteic killer suppression protein